MLCCIHTLNEPKSNTTVSSWVLITSPAFKKSGTTNPCDATACADLQILSNKNYEEIQQFSVFPNPSSGDFTITSKQRIKNVTIYSMDGRVITTMYCHTNDFKLDISRSELNYFSGVVLIKLELQNGQISTGYQILN